ncbi:MAG: hypothetical protein ABL962_08200 [Fimbriimonadaceae bacterium]
MHTQKILSNRFFLSLTLLTFSVDCVGILFAQDGRESGNSMKAPMRIGADEISATSKRAIKGDANASYTLYQHFMFSNDPINSMRWLRLSALQGNSIAQYSMYSHLSFLGKNSHPAELAEGLLWLARSAKGGYEPAVEEQRAIMEEQK